MPYFGGKITLAPRIVSVLPPHAHYVGRRGTVTITALKVRP